MQEQLAKLAPIGALTSHQSTIKSIEGPGLSPSFLLHTAIAGKLSECNTLTEEEVVELANKCKELLQTEGNVTHVHAPVVVVGDTHGQFHDLIEIFKIAGPAPDTNYLFLGDYVDRGYYSVETVCMVIALKVRYPSRVVMIRGNHESRQITQVSSQEAEGYGASCAKAYPNVHMPALTQLAPPAKKTPPARANKPKCMHALERLVQLTLCTTMFKGMPVIFHTRVTGVESERLQMGPTQPSLPQSCLIGILSNAHTIPD
eukprot:1149254-Pelagomonas_calceolata.AAC.8